MQDPDAPIACAEIILRGAKRKFLGWNPACPSQPTVLYQAFTLRQDESYLSVDRLSRSTCEASFARWPANLLAAASLHVGRVRDLGLRVEPRTQDAPDDPAHAGIVGLPSAHASEGEFERAKVLAIALCEMSRLLALRGPEVLSKLRRDYDQRAGQ